MEKLDELDRRIIEELKKSPKTSYKLAKDLKISWASINLRCYRLLAKGILKAKIEEVRRGVGKRVVWSVKR